jgi:Ran GTPase-activating protein (RanGAP) involved in mRNA processing and transport
MSDAEFNKLITRIAHNDPDLRKIRGRTVIEDMYFKKSLTEASEIAAARANVWCADRVFVLAAAMRQAHETASNGSGRSKANKGCEGPGLLNLQSLDFSYCNDLLREYGGTYFAGRNNYLEVGNIVSCRPKVQGEFGTGFRPLPMQARVEISRVPQGTVNIMYDDGKLAYAVPRRFVMGASTKSTDGARIEVHDEEVPASMMMWNPMRCNVGRPFYRKSNGGKVTNETASWSRVLTAPIPLAELGQEARRCTRIDICCECPVGVAPRGWTDLPEDYGVRLAAALFGETCIDATSFLLAPLACKKREGGSVQYCLTLYWFARADDGCSTSSAASRIQFHNRRIILDCISYDLRDDAESPFEQIVGYRNPEHKMMIVSDNAGKSSMSVAQMREQIQALHSDWKADRLGQISKVPDYDGAMPDAEQEDAEQLVRALVVEAGFDIALTAPLNSQSEYPRDLTGDRPKMVFRRFISERKKDLYREPSGDRPGHIGPVLSSLSLPASLLFQKQKFQYPRVRESEGDNGGNTALWQQDQQTCERTTMGALRKNIMQIMEERQGQLVEAAMKRGVLQELFVVPMPIGSSDEGSIVCRIAHRVDHSIEEEKMSASLPTPTTKSEYTLMFSDGAIEFGASREHFVLAAPQAKGELAFFDATPEIEGLVSHSVLRLEGDVPIPIAWKNINEGEPLLLRIEGEDNDGNTRIMTMAVDGVNVNRQLKIPTQCCLAGKLSDGGSRGLRTGFVRILPEVNAGDRVMTSESADAYRPGVIDEINDNTYSVKVDDGTVRRLRREQLWLDRTSELNLAQMAAFDRLQCQTTDYSKPLLYPTEPLEDGAPVLVRVDIGTGMPSASGTLIVESSVRKNGAKKQANGTYTYVLEDFQHVGEKEHNDIELERGTHLNAFFPLPPRETLDAYQVSIELLVAERTDRIPCYRAMDGTVMFPTEDASGRARNRDLFPVERVARHLVPGRFCSASTWAAMIEPSQLNHDGDGNLRPTTTGLKGRDAAYGSYGLYFDETATIIRKRCVTGCPEGEFVYDIQVESSGQMRRGVPRHSFWIAEEAPDVDTHELKVGTAVLIRASPRDQDTKLLKTGAGIPPAKTCFYGFVNGPQKEDPQDKSNKLVKVIFVRPGFLSSGILEKEQFTDALARTAKLDSSSAKGRYEEDCIMCECLVSRRDLQPFSRIERIDPGWKVSVSSYGSCGRHTREFAQPRAREWWRAAELLQAHVPICSEGKPCTTADSIGEIDLDLRLRGSGEILRHCTLDDTIAVEPGLRVLAFPKGWAWKDQEYVPSVPRLDGKNEGRDVSTRHVGNNCTPDVATIVSVTTAEEFQQSVAFRQDLRDAGVSDVPNESEFDKEHSAVPFCTVEFDDPKPDEGVRIVVVCSRTAGEEGIASVLASLTKSQTVQQDAEAKTTSYFHVAHGMFDTSDNPKHGISGPAAVVRKPAKLSVVVSETEDGGEKSDDERLKRVRKEFATACASKTDKETLILYLYENESDSLEGIKLKSKIRKRILSMQVSQNLASDDDKGFKSSQWLPTLDLSRQTTIGCVCTLSSEFHADLQAILIPIVDFARLSFRKECVPVRGEHIFPLPTPSSSAIVTSARKREPLGAKLAKTFYSTGEDGRQWRCLKKGTPIWSQRRFKASLSATRVHPDIDLIKADSRLSAEPLRELLVQCRTAVRELKMNHACLNGGLDKAALRSIVQALSDLTRECPKKPYSALGQYFLPPLSGTTVNWGGFYRTQPVLHTLELTDVGLMENGTVQLCHGLKSNRSLTRLLLGQNAMGDRGAAAVARVVSVHPKLTYLDLSTNMLTTAAAFSLAQAVSRYRVATVVGTHQSLTVKKILSTENNNLNNSEASTILVGVSEQDIWLTSGMKVLVETPNDSNETLFTMAIGTVVEDQQNLSVRVLLDGEVKSRQLPREVVHIPWRELQRWSSKGTAQEDIATIFLRRGIAFADDRMYHKAVQCFKIAMEERCRCGIVAKKDSLWCEAKSHIKQLLGGVSPPLCHRLSHHQECKRSSQPGHYTYLPKKRTVNVLSNGAKRGLKGILRYVPEWEKNMKGRLGVVISGEAGRYQVRSVVERTYTREQMAKSQRLTKNGYGGFTWAKDMKLRELAGKFFIVWDEYDGGSSCGEDFTYWDDVTKVLELQGVDNQDLPYDKLRYEHGSAKKFPKIGVHAGTCVILPDLEKKSGDPSGGKVEPTRQVYIVRKKFYTEAQFSQSVQYPQSEYTEDMQMYYRRLSGDPSRRSKDIDSFGRSCVPFKVIEWRSDGTCEVEECGEIVTLRASDCLKRETSKTVRHARASTPGRKVRLPLRFALSEVEIVEIGTSFDVEFVARAQGGARGVAESGVAYSDCKSTTHPFMVAAPDIEENVNSHRIRSLEGTFLGVGATVEVLKTSDASTAGAEEKYSPQRASASGFAPAPLNTLILDENHLVNTGVRVNFNALVSLVHACAGSGVMEHLSLSHIQLGDEGAAAISRALAHPHNRCSLRTLNLTNCNIDTAGYKQLLCMLSANRHLKKIELANNLIYETWDEDSAGLHFDPKTWPKDSPWKPQDKDDIRSSDEAGGNLLQAEALAKQPLTSSGRTEEESAMGIEAKQNLILKSLRDILTMKPTLQMYDINTFIKDVLLPGKVKYDDHIEELYAAAAQKEVEVEEQLKPRKAQKRKSSVNSRTTIVLDPFKSPEGDSAVLFGELSLGIKVIPDSTWEYEPRCPDSGVKFTNELLYSRYLQAKSENNALLANALLEHQRWYTREATLKKREQLACLVDSHFDTNAFPKGDLEVARNNVMSILGPYIDVRLIATEEQIEAGVLFVKKTRLEQVREINDLDLKILAAQGKEAKRGFELLKELWVEKPNIFDVMFDPLKFDLKYGGCFDAAVGVAPRVSDTSRGGGGRLAVSEQRPLIAMMLQKQELAKRGMIVAFGDDEEGANVLESAEIIRETMQTPNNAWIYAYRKDREKEKLAKECVNSPPPAPSGGGACRWHRIWGRISDGTAADRPQKKGEPQLWYHTKLMRAEVAAQTHTFAREVTVQCLQLPSGISSSRSVMLSEGETATRKRKALEQRADTCHDLRDGLHLVIGRVNRLLAEKDAARGEEMIAQATSNLRNDQERLDGVKIFLKEMGKSPPPVNLVANGAEGLDVMEALLKDTFKQITTAFSEAAKFEKKVREAPACRERAESRQHLEKCLQQVRVRQCNPHDIATLKYAQEPYLPKFSRATRLQSGVLALRHGASSDTLDNSPEALWYFRRLGANVLRLLLQAEGKRLRGPDIPIYSVDTQTRRLLAVLTGTANVRLKDDPRDDEDNANPQLFCKNTVDWRDRKDRLVMFGRLIESLSPLVFAKDRTPLTDPIG